MFPFVLILKYRYMKELNKKIWDIYDKMQDKNDILYIGNRDYVLEKEGNKYFINFSDIYGFNKNGYNPCFYFDFETRLWHTEVEGMHIVSLQNVPLFELVCELRGYTLLDNISKGDVIIDAGCSDAFVATYFGEKVGSDGLVIALEPDDTLYDIAKNNIIANNLEKNVLLVKKAFYYKNTTVDFSVKDNGGSKIISCGNDAKSVETTDLGTLLKDNDINEERVRFIKLDIEGAELDVLADLVDFVSRNKNCVVAFASYHKVNGTYSWMEAEKRYAEHPDVLLKTTYPIHITTFIINKSNKNLSDKMAIIPRIEEVYDRIKI